MCLNARTEKWNDRGKGWVNKLPVCQSERVSMRPWPFFAPLVTHANLPVNLHLHVETTLFSTFLSHSLISNCFLSKSLNLQISPSLHFVQCLTFTVKLEPCSVFIPFSLPLVKVPV